MEGSLATDLSARKFASWVDEYHPVEVDLSSRDVNDLNLRIIATSLRRNNKLRQILFNNNSITASGCGIFADILRNNAGISSINLLYNPICTTISDPYDNQASIHEFVETCNEMQNIRSVCGLGPLNNEIVLSSIDDKEQSNVLLLGIDLRLDTDLLSLRYQGTLGLSEIFESLRDNRSLVRASFTGLQPGSGEFDLALITFLERNLSVKTLQFAFHPVHRDDSDHREAEGTKSILMCIARSMEKNLGVTCLQLDCWPRDRETVTGLSSMLRKNSTLLHVALFNSVLRVVDMEAIASALEYNTTLRVLYINENSCESSSGDQDVSSDGGAVKLHLLTAEVMHAFEAAAKKRRAPFIIRTESKDFIFGSTRQMTVPPAKQWEVEDRVELRSDEDAWQRATVIAVHPDQRYSVRLDESNTVRLHCLAKLLRAGEGFVRCTSIPEVPTIGPNTASTPVEPGPAEQPTTSQVQQTSAETSNERSSAATAAPFEDGVAASESHFPVVYAPDQAVEVRYLGDSRWLPGVVVHTDRRQPTEVVTVRLQLPLDLVEAAKGSSAKAPVEQMVEDTAEFEACFVRPALPSSAVPVRATDSTPVSAPKSPMLTYSEAHLKYQELNPGKAFYDPGAYVRGDYVEVRMLSSSSEDTQGFTWKRGRLATDRKNGTYDVRMETGVDIGAVRGCHLRYHFRPRDVVDCRTNETQATSQRGGEQSEDALPDSPEASSPDEREGDSDGKHHKHHRHHKKSHHHHHHSKRPAHSKDKAKHQAAAGRIEDLSPPQPSLWTAALVMKQEKTGTYVISGESGVKEKGIPATRLMPGNRNTVRSAAEEMRVMSQSWRAPDIDAGDAEQDVEDGAGDGVAENSVGLRGSISLGDPLEVAPLLPPLDEALSNFEPLLPAKVETITEALSPRVAESPATLFPALSAEDSAVRQSPVQPQPSPQDVPGSNGGSSVPPTPRNSTVAALMTAAPTPRNSTVAGLTNAPFTPRNSMVAGLMTSAPTPRPLISSFDINDRIEVSQGFLDGESIWVAGRVEAIHPDNCTYFVRYVDGSTDKAVSGKRMRRANVVTPARNGSRFIDKTAPATPVALQPETPVVAAEQDRRASLQSLDEGGSSDEEVHHTMQVVSRTPAGSVSVPAAAPIPAVVAAALSEAPQSSSQPEDRQHEHHHRHHHDKHHSHGRKKSESASATRSDSPPPRGDKEAVGGEEKAHAKQDSPIKAVPARTVYVQEPQESALLPPLRSPERRAPESTRTFAEEAPQKAPVLTVGMWLSVFNAATKSFEPCMVESVYEDGVFDACNKRGELYRRIDHRYIEPDSVVEPPMNGPPAAQATVQGPPTLANASVPPSAKPVQHTPAEKKNVHSEDVSDGPPEQDAKQSHSVPAQREAMSRTPQVLAPIRPQADTASQPVKSNQKQPTAKANKNQQKLATFKVGAKVDACVDPHDEDGQPVWEQAIIVKKLSPEIYTVYLEDAGEELTLVTGKIRHRGATVDHSFDADRSVNRSVNRSAHQQHNHRTKRSGHEDRPEVSSSEENPPLPSVPRRAELDTSLASSHAFHGADDGLGVSLRDAMNPTDYGFADLAAEGSLDGSLDDDELVVVGTQYCSGIPPLMPMAMLDSNGSLAGLDADLRGAAMDSFEGLEDASHPYQAFPSRRPVTAPIHTSRSHADRAAERSSSANRNDQSQHHHRHRHHQHHGRGHRTAAESEREQENEHPVNTNTPLKPVSIGAGISPSASGVVPMALQYPNYATQVVPGAASSGPPAGNDERTRPAGTSADNSSPPVDDAIVKVFHRTHAAPQHWCPLVAVAELSAIVHNDEASPLADWTVVAFSEFASFRDSRNASSSTLSWEMSSTQSASVLSMCVHENAPDVCPVKVTFYVQAIIVAEVHFEVCTTVATLRSSAAKTRTHTQQGGSQELSKIRQYAVEAQASWACAKSSVYRHIHVLSCEIPTPASAGAVDAARNMTHHVFDEALEALPSFLSAQLHTVSDLSDRAVREDVLGADKVQLVCASADGTALTRETWLALLHSTAELSGLVKSLCASGTLHDTDTPQHRLSITNVATSVGNTMDSDGSHADWLYSVGLSPFHLDVACTSSGNQLAANHWVYSLAPSVASSSAAASGDDISMRLRYVSTLQSVCQSLADLQQRSSDEVPLGLLLLPPESELPGSAPAARATSAAPRNKKGKNQPGNNPDADLKKWQLVFLCDSLSSPALEGSGGEAGRAPVVCIPVDLTAQLVFDLAPLLKCTTALVIAHKVASELGAPSTPLPFATQAVAAHLKTDQLVELFGLYCELEVTFLSSRFSSDASTRAPVSRSLLSFSGHQGKQTRGVAQADAGASVECAVKHLESSLLSIHQRDPVRCVSALKSIIHQETAQHHHATSPAQIVKLHLGSSVHWIHPSELHESWRALAELSRPDDPQKESAHCLLNVRELHLDLQDLSNAATGRSPRALGIADELSASALSRTVQSALQGEQQSSPSSAKRELQNQLAQVILHEVGVKDAFSAQEAAACLVTMGCASYIDFVSIGTVFATVDGRIEVDKLRVFLHEGGIPLFIAAKLAVFIQNKLSR